MSLGQQGSQRGRCGVVVGRGAIAGGLVVMMVVVVRVVPVMRPLISRRIETDALGNGSGEFARLCHRSIR